MPRWLKRPRHAMLKWLPRLLSVSLLPLPPPPRLLLTLLSLPFPSLPKMVWLRRLLVLPRSPFPSLLRRPLLKALPPRLPRRKLPSRR
ncbi:hypothetical protein BC828DRAFT_377637 [Blastocladiella britannica]|nr:hypothetical protein BC828DRAFT_377637 [Blastocladiella britannica]